MGAAVESITNQVVRSIIFCEDSMILQYFNQESDNVPLYFVVILSVWYV